MSGNRNTRYQTAVSGPEARSPCWLAGSSPNSGSKPQQRSPRRRLGGEEAEHDDQRDQAADIAQAPGRSRQAAELGARHEMRHHRVVEHRGEFHADQRQHEPAEHAQRIGVAGERGPQHEAADRGRNGEGEDPRLARAHRVGDGAQDGREQGDQQTAEPGRIAPELLPAGRVGRDACREVGGKDEGDDQRMEGLLSPVEQHPPPDAATRRWRGPRRDLRHCLACLGRAVNARQGRSSAPPRPSAGPP